MAVKVERLGDVAVVAPEGNFFGGKETDELDKTIKSLQGDENKKMVLDLGRVNHLNSMAIGLLVGAHTNYQKRAGASSSRTWIGESRMSSSSRSSPSSSRLRIPARKRSRLSGLRAPFGNRTIVRKPDDMVVSRHARFADFKLSDQLIKAAVEERARRLESRRRKRQIPVDQAVIRRRGRRQALRARPMRT